MQQDGQGKYQLFPKGRQSPCFNTNTSVDPETAFALAMNKTSERNDRSGATTPTLKAKTSQPNLNRRRKVAIPDLGPMTTVHESPMDSRKLRIHWPSNFISNCAQRQSQVDHRCENGPLALPRMDPSRMWFLHRCTTWHMAERYMPLRGKLRSRGDPRTLSLLVCHCQKDWHPWSFPNRIRLLLYEK